MFHRHPKRPHPLLANFLRGDCSTQLGFTLLEKMILIAVISILAAISIPNISRLLSRMKLDQAVAETKAALNETQQAAIRGNQACVITLDTVEGEVTGDCLVNGRRSLPSGVSIATNMLDFIRSDSSVRDTPLLAVSDTPSVWGLSGQAPTLMASRPASLSEPIVGRMEIHIISSSSPNCSGLRRLFPWCWWMGTEEPPETDTTVIPVAFGALGTPTFTVASKADIPIDPSGKIVLHLPEHNDIQKKCVAISNTLGLMRVGNYEGTTEPTDITDSGTCKAAGWQAQ